MSVPSPSSVPRVSATAVPPAPLVPHTARGRGERPVAYAVRSPRLNTQQVIFWPTVQTIQNLPVPSPNSVSPRQISSGGDPLRFLGSGYPPRQMLTARKGADGVEDPVSSYIPAEVNCMRPLTTKVFGPPKVIARPVVQDPKRSNPIIRSFSGVVAKEVAESPRADTSPGAEAPAASPATTTPATPATPSTPAMAAMVTTAGPSPAPAMVPPSSSPSVPGVPAVVANPNPEAMKGSKSMPPAKVMESPPVSVHQEPIRLRWPIGSSTPTLSTPSVLVWHGYASGRQGTVVPSPKLQPRRVALGSPEGSPAASEGDGKPLKEPTKEDSTEGQDVTDGTSGPSGLKERPSGTLGTIGTFSTGTPITTPRELADRFMAGTYTPPPPHFQMFRSTSTQPDMRPTSPHGRLGVTVRNLSPQTRGAGGALISPSPLSFSSRQPPVPRRSGHHQAVNEFWVSNVRVWCSLAQLEKLVWTCLDVILEFLEMLQVTVALPSGCCEKFSIPQSSKVGDLRVLAQKSFQCSFLRLVAADHHALDPTVSLQAAGLEDGDHLTAIVQEAKLAATPAAFAFFCPGGDRVVTWGHDRHGGDSSGVQDQLKGVQQVQATFGAFAAILADGSVVTWGKPEHGSDSSEVQDQLKGVQQVQATKQAFAFGAFAAILADGSVVTWGKPDYGGDSSVVQDQLKGVQQIQATEQAFAAILADGSVVAWGKPDSGGDSSSVQDQLKGVQQVQATKYAFAAIMADGSVVTWGKPDSGGECSAVQDHLKGAQQVQATFGAFAAILADGSVVTWGKPEHGGDSSEVQDKLKGVQQVQANFVAFAAILADGSVVTWGKPDFGGDSSAVQDQLKGVQRVQATGQAFAAILADGSVVTWGKRDSGGDSSAVQEQLKGVQQVQATERAFAAILADGSVVTWGKPDLGGDSSVVQDQLKGVQQLQATERAFAAILADGSVVTWGKRDYGGDSSAVAANFACV
eukprot:s1113_g3.t1